MAYRASVVEPRAEKSTVPTSFAGATLYIDSGPGGQNLGMVQISATLAQDTDTVQIVLDPGMSLGTTFQFGTIASNCNTVGNGSGTGSCTAAWLLHGNTITLNRSRPSEGSQPPGPFVTTQSVAFGTVFVPGTTLTGTARLTSGATLQMMEPGNPPVTITSGPFSVPVGIG